MTTRITCPTCDAPLPPDAPAQVCPRCLLGAGLTEPPEADEEQQAEGPFSREALAQHFPKLEILEQLGEGGMGVVYKARQKDLDRLVALKLLRPTVADDPAFAERFGREARALARLSHPNIVGVHEFGEHDGLYYFMMEYVDGCTLRDAMSAGGLEPVEALRIVPLICDALQFAHDQGVVHRDIKPENVLIGLSGEVKIADFGLAKLVERGRDDFTLTRRDQVMGTPHYMAPEQIETPQEVDHRADIYSLGVVFYELLTGELPIGRFDPPSERAHTDVRLDGVVLRTLEKERERRYQHASEVRSTLQALEESGNGGAAAGSPAVPTPLPADDGVRRPSRRSDLCRRAVVGLLLVVGSVPLAALGLFIGGGGNVVTISGPLIAGLLCLIVGWVTSISAWTHIHHNSDRLHGKGFAIAGTFLPLLLCVGMLLVAPLMWFRASQAQAVVATRTVPISSMESEEAAPPPPMQGPRTDEDVAVRGGPPAWDVHDFQREKAAVIARVAAAKTAIEQLATAREYWGEDSSDERGAAAIEPLRQASIACYLPEHREQLSETSPRTAIDGPSGWADDGFPLLPQEELRSDIAKYRLLIVEFGEGEPVEAEVILRAPAGEQLTAHLRRTDGGWFFVRERVRVEQTR